METELRNSVEVKVKDLRNSTNEFDHNAEERKGEKEEAMDDNDSETETETKEDENFEEESEDEDTPLADNHVMPGPFKNVDSIVCLGTEPDKAMVNIQFLFLLCIKFILQMISIPVLTLNIKLI